MIIPQGTIHYDYADEGYGLDDIASASPGEYEELYWAWSASIVNTLMFDVMQKIERKIARKDRKRVKETS